MTTLINRLMIATLIFLSLGQLGRISFLNQNINGYLYEIPLVVTLGILMVRYRLAPLKSLPNLLKILMLLLVYLTVHLLFTLFMFNPQENLIAGLYLVRLWLYSLFFAYGYHFYNQHKNYSHHLARAFQGIMGFTIVTSVSQYFFFSDLRVLFYSGWDPHLYRMLGLFFDPPIAAGFYGIFFFLVLLNPQNFIRNIFLQRGLLAILFVCLMLTYSRGAFLAFIVSMFIYLLRRKLYAIIGIFLAIFTIGLFFLPKTFGEGVNLLRTSTIESRMVDYQEGFLLFSKFPLGIGYNHIRAVKTTFQIPELKSQASHSGASFHSSFLIILVTGGVIGLILFVAFLFMLARSSEVMNLVVIFLSILSLTDNVLLHPFILVVVFMLSFIPLSDTSP